MSCSELPYIVGVDIGGANLKLADSCGRSTSCRFPMWLQPDLLGERLCEVLKFFPAPDELAITMTGELADCFTTRREGVSRILDQVARAFPPKQTFVYAIGNRWLSPEEARQAPWSVAASNWHALATWLCTCIPNTAFLLLDIGSTTTDIIPVSFNRAGELALATSARSDRDRLVLQQLVYTGIQRTPIAAIVRDVTLLGQRCPVMAERFATSDDCYLLLALVPEDPANCDTADGCPRTMACAHSRLARMIGEDGETLCVAQTQLLAEQIIDSQAQQIASAMIANLHLLGKPRDIKTSGAAAPTPPIIIGGHGRPLAARALAKLGQPVVPLWLEELLSPSASRAAPAAAVAALRLASRGAAGGNQYPTEGLHIR